jgi:muramoyltetrapeptide carboxypeptidase LdcA involved in peptidoglycan recycling
VAGATWPPSVQPGATLALFSPSSPGPLKYPTRYARARTRLEQMGFSLVEGETTLDGYANGSPRRRADDFVRLVTDPGVDAVLTTIGGLNTIEMLPYVDYAAIAVSPKAVCGYSDASVLLNAVLARSDVVTFHGPAALPTFGEYPAPPEVEVESFLAVLGRPTEPLPLPVPDEWTDELLEWEGPEEVSRPRRRVPNDAPVWLGGDEEAEATVVGGNLNSLVHIAGSGFWPALEECVLLLESVEASTPEWAQNLWSLRLRGVLRGVRGVLVGKPERTPPDVWDEIHALLEETFAEEAPGAPVVTGLDVGHTSPILTVPVGGRVRISPADRSIILLPPAEAREPS